MRRAVEVLTIALLAFVTWFWVTPVFFAEETTLVESLVFAVVFAAVFVVVDAVRARRQQSTASRSDDRRDR